MHGNKDRPFQHYTITHRITSWISRTLFDNLTYTVRHGLLKGMKRKGGLGWIPEFNRRAGEAPQQRFFANLDLSGKIVFDIGAFEGLLTLFFARGARHVVCYEPNPRNRARLFKNLRLNAIQNVTVREYGLGAQACTSTIMWGPNMPGGTTVAGTGMSATIDRRGDVRHADIQVTTLDKELAEEHLLQPDFMKVDVEGYELPVLQGARHLLETKHPVLYLEMHGETISEKQHNARAIVEYLIAVGYRDILHIESARKITVQNCEDAARGHLYVNQ